MKGPKFQTKIPCYSRVFLPGEQQPVDPPSKDEELRVIGFKRSMVLDTRKYNFGTQ